MTRLIIPTEQDPELLKVIQNIELRRITSEIEPLTIQVFKLPPKFNNTSQPEKEIESVSDSSLSADYEIDEDHNTENERNDHMIDWLDTVEKLSQESDDDALRKWLIEQGYDHYFSIMQGPRPVTKNVRETSLPTDDEHKVYKNMYGELEIRVNENCVLQMQSTGRESNDFERNLPPRIICKHLPKPKLSFQKQDSE